MFICGSGSFGHEDEEDNINRHYPNPKRSTRRSMSFGKILGRGNNHDNKNPYAQRGLDKFYALLAELDDKKQKIYTEMGSEDVAYVHFVYSHDSDDFKPVVVKVQGGNKEEKKQKTLIDKTPPPPPPLKAATTSSSHEDTKKKRSLRNSLTFKVMENLRKPYYYIPILVMLILLFLAIYGRAFAILCTSIGFYVVPNVFQGSSSSSSSSSSERRKLKRKKEFARKQSNNQGPSSPRSVINGLSQ